MPPKNDPNMRRIYVGVFKSGVNTSECLHDMAVSLLFDQTVWPQLWRPVLLSS